MGKTINESQLITRKVRENFSFPKIISQEDFSINYSQEFAGYNPKRNVPEDATIITETTGIKSTDQLPISLIFRISHFPHKIRKEKLVWKESFENDQHTTIFPYKKRW